MAFRTLVITETSKLELSLGYLVVRKREAVIRVHLAEIDAILVETTSAALTTALLCELSRRKIKIIFCDEKHNPFAEMVDFYGSVDSTLRIREQISWPESIKSAVWTSIVRAKITRQRQLLLDEGHVEAADLLRAYCQSLKPGDPDNREGHAAKVYFNTLFGQGFNRQFDSPVNAALNYGYSILLSTFNKEIVSRGYLTQLGIFHDNQFNQFNLSSDLMEPFRAFVDRKVLTLSITEFTLEIKHELVDLLNQPVMIDSSRQLLSNAINIYCSSVFRALLTADPSQLLHYQWSDS